MQFSKLYLSVSLLLIGAVWVACVDIPSGPASNTQPNFRSMVRFAHMAQSRAANSITIDGAAAGPSMSYLGNSGYLDVSSGSRSLSFGGTPALTQAFGSEQQSTLVIYEVGTAIAYLNLVEGHKDKNNGVPGFAQVKFVNVANGAAATVAFRKDSARLNTTTSNTLASSAFGAAPQYTQLDPGARSVFAVSSGGYTTGSAGTIKGANEVPPVTSGSTGSGTVDFSVDAGLVMNVTVKSMNSEGFYTAAHIHNGAAGVAGPVLYPLPVAAQNMTFKTITVSGAQEVPPVTTTDSATVTVSAKNDSSATGGATYSITTKTSTASGFFTGAHIHNAAAGVNGGIIHPINITKQTISFPTLTATGAQEVPPVTGTTARATCTFTFWKDSLQYSVKVFRDAVDTPFTAMHFHKALAAGTGPVVRDIRTTPWSNDSLVVSGTWKTTDAQPLTAGLVDSIRQGLVYFNVHSTGRPAGIIRANLTPNATHTNTFSGTFTGTAFFNLKDEFAFSRMYFNFHTSANPGGQMRGQAIPDTFTTNAYTATIANVPDSIGALLNQGRIYYNFHTALQPSGAIRGQLGVDPTKGQYAVSSQSLTFDAGRMYTVIATGQGLTFQMVKLDDRIFGVTKPATTPVSSLERKVSAQKSQGSSD